MLDKICKNFHNTYQELLNNEENNNLYYILFLLISFLLPNSNQDLMTSAISRFHSFTGIIIIFICIHLIHKNHRK